MRGFVTDCFNVSKPLDLGAKTVYSTCMKNETTLPVYDSLENLLAAEVPSAPTLRDRCVALADELSDFGIDYCPDGDLALALDGLTEANLYATAEAIASLADWFA